MTCFTHPTKDGRVGVAETGSRADASSPQAVSTKGFDPARLPDFNVVYDGQPAAPVRDRKVEVCVVARRCVYVNNRRIAGSKPYISEGLPSHTLKTTLGKVLDAFTEKEIRAALREGKARRDYFAAYHAAKAQTPSGEHS
jgi:hypothetical protein